MLRLTIVSVLIALAVARTPRFLPTVPMLDGRIVGGEPTTIEDHPYQLSLEFFQSHTCGASIISVTKALTAAHCTYGHIAASFDVRAGSTYRGKGGQKVRVSKVCQHPHFDIKTVNNDVSVLTLFSPLVFGSGVQPIPLVGIGSPPSVGTLATVAGWGTTSAGGSSSQSLLKVQIPRVSQTACENAYAPRGYYITDRMICFGYTQGGKDTCQGDSGGPLVTGGQQVGIVSWGIGCASKEYPGVYADLSSDYLRDHIDNC